jgi:hypothetical protein
MQSKIRVHLSNGIHANQQDAIGTCQTVSAKQQELIGKSKKVFISIVTHEEWISILAEGNQVKGGSVFSFQNRSCS